MVLLYPYTIKEQQQLSTPYPFVEYQGDDFIRAYSQTRERALALFPASSTVSSDLLPATHHPAGSTGTSGEIATSCLLDAISDGDENVLKKLRRKAELRKVRNRYYGRNLSAGDTADADIVQYLRLAKALSSHYLSTQNLQSLSTLLKVNDTIISRAEEVGSAYACSFSAVLGEELDAIRRLYRSLCARPITKCLVPGGTNAAVKSEKNEIENLGMIVQDAVRSRAYLQGLLKAGYKPRSAIILGENTFVDRGLEKAVVGEDYFDPGESFFEIVRRENILYQLISATAFNDPRAIASLRQAEEEYFIFSGSGILKEGILSCGKKLIHIHPGRLPDFRGSTTFLYSLLAEGKCAATGFLMNSGIDTGDIIASQEFLPPNPEVDISRIYDPYIRSQVLVDVVTLLAENGSLSGERQKPEGETYYIIHPVLRTLAIGYQKGELGSFAGL